MTTDITELTGKLKHANQHRISRLIVEAPNDELRQLASEVEQYTDQLIEALERAQQHIARQEQIILNQDESLSIRRGELEKAQNSNEFLKGQLSELANFNPDWDKLEASYESWREIAAELLVAKDRIAELQIVSDKCFLSGLKTGWEYGTNHDGEGYNREISDAQAVIYRATGIKVEVE
ncbi:hypothetical protein SB6411_00243 [Klebsiella spallanzanii]|uniref:Ead/Ea22-like family protein n=1 Tax=Klebsiella spallanzanii TaxID=2587528 RepID=A0ABY6V7K0_9ENTR|nr:hypothetical protein [Klebsiella spallanzanii]VUS22828.1 hypothetical protein SB6411_00243 [Klebsiella spallanzanii]